jgi:hypothetical protein
MIAVRRPPGPGAPPKAQGHSEQTIDAVAKAIARFEE